ncbi:MobA/MobL family protein [Pseudomonas syringae]|uniref:MobA/MobL family protein n=1 Tax=Pseudomonas syringae TaxID=317 RepID=UPI000D40B087|nr:MobA/MobL family protein [Pseudomonas syringae]POR66262.1 hypothetical protein BKM27_25325 [Pseudomonas syringae pv. syringae]POR74165.1 hypothetical protein BKM30_25030 [Pseudomonas syringae pv. syringae]
MSVTGCQQCLPYDFIRILRAPVGAMANRALENAGSDARIDSCSLKAQGLNREATMHLGLVASDMKRRAKASDRGDGDRQVAVNNAMLEQI